MDLFFDVWLNLKNDFYLWRIVRMSLKDGIEIKIYSADDLIVIVKGELDQVEWCYLIAARNLVKWCQRNYDHASSSTRKGDSKSWTEKLKEQLGVVDEVDNAKEGWEMLSVRAD